MHDVLTMLRFLTDRRLSTVAGSNIRCTISYLKTSAINYRYKQTKIKNSMINSNLSFIKDCNFNCLTGMGGDNQRVEILMAACQ